MYVQQSIKWVERDIYSFGRETILRRTNDVFSCVEPINIELGERCTSCHRSQNRCRSVWSCASCYLINVHFFIFLIIFRVEIDYPIRISSPTQFFRHDIWQQARLLRMNQLLQRDKKKDAISAEYQANSAVASFLHLQICVNQDKMIKFLFIQREKSVAKTSLSHVFFPLWRYRTN